MRILLLALVASIAAQTQSDQQLTQLLDRTSWIDIGVGRSLGAMTTKQIVALRMCPEPTMAFQLSRGSWMQSFYAGLEMRTVYKSAVVKSDPAGRIVLFYTAGRADPVETLHLSRSGDVLVERTHGFRPRTFLKCNPARSAAPKSSPRK
jgi:hypothetical protein